MDDYLLFDYNPNRPIDSTTWLALDEDDRNQAVEAYHRKTGDDQRIGDGFILHCALQATVETQIAMQVPEVRAAFRKLRLKKVKRHNALHALMYALSHVIYNAKQIAQESNSRDGNAAYFKELKKLRTSEWK